MKIVVCIKQVPDTNEVKLDPVTNRLIRDGVPSIINHDDKAGIEAALQLRESLNDGSTVTVVCMGPPQADVALREALAMGCDDAYLLSAREFGGSDTCATAIIISAALKKIGYDLVITGRQAIDGDTAQVGPQIAEKMDLPQVTYVKNFAITDDMKTITVERALEDGHEVIEIQTPCMLTAIKELNTPRYMNIAGIYNPDKKITVWNAADIEVDLTTVGLKASPTNVFRSFTPKPKGKGMMLAGDTEKDLAKDLLIRLKDKHVI